MNEYLIEYYGIDPNERLEVVHLSDKSNCNGYKYNELSGYLMIHNARLADIEDVIVPYNNAWWLYTKADDIKEAINKFYLYMAVIRDANTYELLSVEKGKEASDLYHNLTHRDMRIDYNELRAVRPSEESST